VVVSEKPLRKRTGFVRNESLADSEKEGSGIDLFRVSANYYESLRFSFVNNAQGEKRQDASLGKEAET
jgi:hypothetical protein